MLLTVITALQVFSIGFILGLTGPCLLYCLPVILALSAGAKENYKKILLGIVTFLSGRLLAYIMLGFLAGVSGFILRQFTDARFSFYLKPVAGIISIAFGVWIFFRQNKEKNCQSHKILTNSGFFIFGFVVGISPCPPLIGLLLEIALISKVPLQGAIYGLIFGLGTFLSGFILAAGLSGVLNRLPKNRIFKGIYALALILFGIVFILR
ncbi:MAG: sulfite exporter TauE/SafE family protein [Candidatus Omnitrophota bacterium]|nr:sulfite exporter TauE/SafE family protein [Candidatus Omnitrophota bacterium]